VVGFDHRDVLEEDLSVAAPPAPFSREEIKRLFFAEAEIMSWNVTRLGDLVCFSAETDGKITDDLHYRVLAKLPNGSTMQVSDRDELLTPDEHMFGACFNIDEIGDPDTIGFSAETWTGDQANRTAWHFVYLSKFPWQESTSQ
ncbi:MAG: hypothetical protein HY835_08870, partial [Anaerolineae bacterium]|nr:hypothetical protein [Anaerolineae bacterium]